MKIDCISKFLLIYVSDYIKMKKFEEYGLKQDLKQLLHQTNLI